MDVLDLFRDVLDGLHELELVRQPEGGGEGEEGPALVKGSQRNWNVKQERRDAKANLKSLHFINLTKSDVDQ